MFFKYLYKDQRGSSYIQIILASTAIAGLALVGLQMAKDQKKLAITVYRKYLMNYLHQEVTYFLSQNENCTASFRAKRLGSVEISGLKSSSESKLTVFKPLKAAKSNEVVYYEEPVFIKRYRILADRGLGHEQIEVSYGLDSETFEKYIPIRVNLDEEGQIEDCRVIGQSVTDTVHGPWKKSGDSIQTKYQNVYFGNNVYKSEGVVLKGGLYMEGQSDLSNCDLKSIGHIKYIRGKGIRYCKDGAWFPLGNQPLRTNMMTPYRLGVSKIGSQSIMTKKHRHCFITKMKKDLLSDGCKMRRLNLNIMSEYEVRAYTSEAATSMECEVSCVD